MSQPLIFYKDQKQRKRKIVFSLITILFALLLIYLLPYTVVYILMGLLIVIEMYLLYIFMTNAPTVTVNADGIKSKVNGMGMVSWDLLEGFEIKDGVNFTALVIMLNNQNAFFANKNSLVTGIMKSNIQRFGSPAVIPASEFNVPLLEVIKMIETYQSSL